MGSSPGKCCCQLSQSTGTQPSHNNQPHRPRTPHYTPAHLPPRQDHQPCQNFPTYPTHCPSDRFQDSKKTSSGSTIFTSFIIIVIIACVYFYYHYVLPRDPFGSNSRPALRGVQTTTLTHSTRSTRGYSTSVDEDDENEDDDDTIGDDSSGYTSFDSSSRNRSQPSYGIRKDTRANQSTQPYVRCTRVKIEPPSNSQSYSSDDENISNHTSRTNPNSNGANRSTTRNSST